MSLPEEEQKLTVTLTIGLPGSGKTTWAKNEEEYGIVNYGRLGSRRYVENICKDDLRKEFPKANEKEIIKTRNERTRDCLNNNISVIWSDTNLNPIHKKTAEAIAKEYDAEVVIKDFTDVPIETCIKRDLMRLESVGKDVIMEMYYKWLCPKEVNIIPDLMERCYIVDIDGTVATTTTRSHYDYTPEAILTDAPRCNVIQLLKYITEPEKDNEDAYSSVGYSGCKLIFVSGRKDSCKDATIQWLNNNGLYPDELHMRATGDDRNDAIVKKEIYDNHIKGKYNVLGVFDDRPRVIRMWEKEGLTVFNVGKGYEF